MARSPSQWRDLLIHKLDTRWNSGVGSHEALALLDAYYEGDQTLAYATKKFISVYGHLFTSLTDNWMPLVVEASAERLRVQGFRFGKQQDADDDAWAIWQANGLDGESNMLHTEAIKLCEAYWMVQPNGEVPKITAEHPSQCIVAHAPGDRRTRLAALKKWIDDDGHIRSNIYLPDRIYKWRSKKRPDEALGIFKDEDEKWTLDERRQNSLGVVPIIPAPNNPSMLRGGASDLAGGPLKIQDGINKLLADMLVGSEYQAFPQRVLLGIDQPKGPDGKPMPIQKAADAAQGSRLWMFPGQHAKAFEFSAADLKNFRESIDGLIRDLTAQTRTPPHYVSGQIVNASGDALKAAETGLVSKVRDKMDPFGEAHEEAMRLAFKSIGDEARASATDAETIWRDPESRSQAELADALTKLATIGVPQEVLWERYGFSPQEIDRMKALQEGDAFLATAQQPTDATQVQTPNGPAVSGTP